MGSVLKSAIISAFKKIEGNSAFVIIEQDTSTIYGIRKKCSISLCGVDSTQTSKFISSDPYAASGITELKLETLYFPENDVLCELKKTALEISFFLI